MLISRRSVFTSDFWNNARSTTTCSPMTFYPVRIYNDCCRLSTKKTHTLYPFRSRAYIRIWMKITKTAISIVWNNTQTPLKSRKTRKNKNNAYQRYFSKLNPRRFNVHPMIVMFCFVNFPQLWTLYCTCYYFY